MDSVLNFGWRCLGSISGQVIVLCSIEKYFTFTVLLSTQVLFVQRLDNAIQWISVYKTYYAISWIEIYPMGGINHPSNNQGQELKIGIGKLLGKTD